MPEALVSWLQPKVVERVNVYLEVLVKRGETCRNLPNYCANKVFLFKCCCFPSLFRGIPLAASHPEAPNGWFPWNPLRFQMVRNGGVKLAATSQVFCCVEPSNLRCFMVSLKKLPK